MKISLEYLLIGTRHFITFPQIHLILCLFIMLCMTVPRKQNSKAAFVLGSRTTHLNFKLKWLSHLSMHCCMVGPASWCARGMSLLAMAASSRMVPRDFSAGLYSNRRFWWPQCFNMHQISAATCHLKQHPHHTKVSLFENNTSFHFLSP